ncbi:MAG: chitobiase/beta-hexosaminidase C-terminal domain-containing protein [Oscillospiraceae bacterium]|nr:chitobiase/beta-hexosaminidase C-terminal domain-containing protein [Oscillospiraceae bacterium]
MLKVKFILPVFVLLLSACAPGALPDDAPGYAVSEAPDFTENDDRRIRVVSTDGSEIFSFTYAELKNAQIVSFSHVYSTVNNWPSTRFFAAEGYSVTDILTEAGVYGTAQMVTFRGEDGYEVSLTAEQLFSTRYFYPNVNENGEDAEPVLPIIAYRWREGSDDLTSVREEGPCLFIGQTDPFEHTNPAFVENISEIVISDAPCEKWPPASTFPLPGPIAEGETVKLQHPDYGLVKLHFTLDGSDPTALSPMYNPSTYRPELNVPIPVPGPTVIKAIVIGYGKTDSEIAVFEFTPQD